MPGWFRSAKVFWPKSRRSNSCSTRSLREVPLKAEVSQFRGLSASAPSVPVLSRAKKSGSKRSRPAAPSSANCAPMTLPPETEEMTEMSSTSERVAPSLEV